MSPSNVVRLGVGFECPLATIIALRGPRVKSLSSAPLDYTPNIPGDDVGKLSLFPKMFLVEKFP